MIMNRLFKIIWFLEGGKKMVLDKFFNIKDLF